MRLDGAGLSVWLQEGTGGAPKGGLSSERGWPSLRGSSPGRLLGPERRRCPGKGAARFPAGAATEESRGPAEGRGGGAGEAVQCSDWRSSKGLPVPVLGCSFVNGCLAASGGIKALFHLVLCSRSVPGGSEPPGAVGHTTRGWLEGLGSGQAPAAPAPCPSPAASCGASLGPCWNSGAGIGPAPGCGAAPGPVPKPWGRERPRGASPDPAPPCTIHAGAVPRHPAPVRGIGAGEGPTPGRSPAPR